MKLELTAAGKKAYADNFPNGSYVEGFTFLTADEGVSLSLPVLGFYGDWNSLKVFQGTYDEGPANITYSVLADVNASLSGNYVGVNNRTDTFARRWMGFGRRAGGRMLRICPASCEIPRPIRSRSRTPRARPCGIPATSVLSARPTSPLRRPAIRPRRPLCRRAGTAACRCGRQL